LLCTVAASLLIFAGRNANAEKPEPSAFYRNSTWIQEVVDDFKGRLDITDGVQVSIVPKNALMVSVQGDDANGFVLSLEQDFMDELSEAELRAAIAHELGHVWIFTHHPYLQTEKLANQIAMRLVTRDNLVTVYEKVWKRQGTAGDLAHFVGD
jgi:hypothetical protein